MSSTLDVEKHLRSAGHPFVTAVARGCINLGLTANRLTALGALITLIACVYLWRGELIIAGAILLFGGLCDTLDGAVAKLKGTVSKQGAFIDSVVDRLSDTLPQLVILIRASQEGLVPLTITVGAAILVTGLIPYIKARGESLGCTIRGGLMSRPTRFILLEVGLFGGSAWLTIALAIIFIGGLMTVIHRFQDCLFQLKEDREVPGSI